MKLLCMYCNKHLITVNIDRFLKLFSTGKSFPPASGLPLSLLEPQLSPVLLGIVYVLIGKLVMHTHAVQFYSSPSDPGCTD